MTDTATPTHADWIARAAAVRPPTRPFIDGDFRAPLDGGVVEDRTPRDGSVIAEVETAGAADVDRAVAAARWAFEDGRWADQAPLARKRVLLRLADLIRANADELALLESLDVGHPIGDATRVDVPGAANCIQWYAEAADKLYGEVGPTGPDALSLVTREPFGVVGALVPWNYPLIITAWKLGPALATGNSVVLKPASHSPLTALRLASLAAEAGLPDGVLNVLPGPGGVVGEAMARHPGIDKLAFTGSIGTGRRLLHAAADSNLKPVQLELGGKSPQLVLADAPDLDAAVSAVGWGIFYNAGQTCNAGSRVLVQRGIKDEFVRRLAAFAEGMQPADPLDPATLVGSLVDRGHLDAVMAYVELGRREGARVVTGGAPVLEDTGGSYLPPTILDAVTNDMRVAREEIFGPVVGIIEFDDPDEAVRLANDTDYGLAAAVWTSDVRLAHRLSRRIRAGMVWVNTFDAADVTVPFGGFKQSGSGRDKSLHALDGYTQLKTTWMDLS
ncbi:MAG TPA: aldehyde dehydrogenase [Candidatus Limnocylindrales bacterium]|nr:aldehyde dehydrogenase [Candidatus Limnocylindrales bacterium]